MTRLTNDMRNKLIINILADIPRVDYKEIMVKRFYQQQMDALPISIRHIELDKLKELFEEHSTYFSKGNTYLRRLVKHVDPGKDEILTRLVESKSAQDERISDIKLSLKSSLSTIATVKGLLKIYPEFEKYLDIQKDVINLPACNVVADLMKAGWRKKE